MAKNLQTVYFAQINGRKTDKYAIYHAFSEDHEYCGPGVTGRYCVGVSRDHLSGYLEGASTGRWNDIELRNGIPREFEYSFEGETTKPVRKKDLKRIIEETGLDAFYPDL